MVKTLLKVLERSTTTFALLFLLFVQRSLLAETFPLWGELEPGPYTVGFKVVSRYDYSRTYKPKYDYEGRLQSGEPSRPIQISIWYPAKKTGDSVQMLYEEYVYLIVKEESFGELTDEEKLQSKKRFAQFAQGAPEDKLQELFKTKTAAFKDASPQAGLFPPILFAQAYNLPPLTNFIMCEYLASHGYIVVTSPPLGMTSRQPSADLKGVETQLRDIEYLSGFVHDFPNVDQKKLGAIGYSTGTLALALLAIRNTNLDALISLDGAIAFNFGYSILYQSIYYDPSKVHIPIMHMTPREQNQNTDLSFFESLKYSALHILKFKGLRHYDFSSFGMISNTMVPNFATFLNDIFGRGPSSADTKRGYEVICRYALNFLNAYMKDNQKSWTFLKRQPEDNGVPKGFLIVESKTGFKAPPTEEQFVDIINKKGIQNAFQIYNAVKKNAPDYVVFKEATINNLGYQFLGSQRIKEAIEIFKLNVKAYPESANVYDSLAEAYMLEGNKDLAIQNYEKTLALLPNDMNISEEFKERLKKGAQKNLEKLK